VDNSALTLTFTDDHGPAEASEFLSEYRDEIMRFLNDEVDVPLGPKITSELAADSVFVSSEHINSENKITLAIKDPKIWLKIGIGIDEHDAILSSAIANMAESITSITYSKAPKELFLHCQEKRDAAFNDMYIVIPREREGMMTSQDFFGAPDSGHTGTAFIHTAGTAITPVFNESVADRINDDMECVKVREAKLLLRDNVLSITSSRECNRVYFPQSQTITSLSLQFDDSYAKNLANAIVAFRDHPQFDNFFHQYVGPIMHAQTGLAIGHQWRSLPDDERENVLSTIQRLTHEKNISVSDISPHSDEIKAIQSQSRVDAFFTGIVAGNQYEGSNIANTQAWQAFDSDLKRNDAKLTHKPMR
tara:strand:- start:1008 stop:2093 length:1086 start_codon:yes stop_codon:yes gene_type:complete